MRIPVAWSNGDKDDGTYTIDPKLLARVEQVANWALNQGMYVIINDHWDNQWWGQFGACYKEMQQETKLQMKQYVLMPGSVMKDTGHRLLTVSKIILTMLFWKSANEELGSKTE